jgi:tetratricopeptide (TPR) repeat protein
VNWQFPGAPVSRPGEFPRMDRNAPDRRSALRYPVRAWTAPLIAAVLFLVAIDLRAASDELFQRGLEAHREGRFAEASKDFRAAIEERPSSGALLNLGLTEWRRGRAGSAVLAWEQARWVDPFDARAKGNLRYARELTGVEAPEYSWYERAAAWLPVNAWAWIAGLSLWLAISMVVLPGVFRWRKAAWHQAVAAVLFGVFLASLPAHFGILTRMNLGFVLQKNVPLRLTPTTEGEWQSKLAAGEPARELRRRGEFVYVQTSRGKGWIEATQFGRICPK